MLEIIKKVWLLQAVEGYALLRFPLGKYNFELNSGIILVVESIQESLELEKTFLQSQMAVRQGKKEIGQLLNWQIGIHVYRKNETEKFLLDFLQQKEGLPVLIVTGVIPTFLEEQADIFRCDFSASEVKDFNQLFRLFREFVLSNVDEVLKQIKLFSTSQLSGRIEGKTKFSCLSVFLIVGEIWYLFFRDKNSENITNCFRRYYNNKVFEAVESMDQFLGGCNVEMTVRQCIIRESKKMKILIRNFENGYCEKAIMFDNENYFFPEELLRQMCSSLLETVSFVQLKHEMANSGMLEYDKKCQNFTVRKCVFNTKKMKNERVRFLKIPKELVMSDEGLPLEMIIENSEREEML